MMLPLSRAATTPEQCVAVGGIWNMTVGRALAALGFILVLAGCNLPRGAGLQSEVLSVQAGPDGATETPDFAALPVSRETLPEIAAWPATGPSRMAWINRQDQPASLLIAPGDLISVTVWDADENSLLTGPGQRVAQLQDVQVSSGGEIFLPFVGEIRVAGMSATTARTRVEELYASSIPSAQVQLSVEPGRANTANLVGGVEDPGIYPLPDRNFTILSLLSEGGGVRNGITNPQVRLFRGNAIYGISLDRLYAEPGLDTTLVGGDRVIIEEEDRYFLSLGAAGSEALHLFPKDRVTALDALSVIGGITDERANAQGILVLRQYPAAAVRPEGSAEPGPPRDRMVFVIDLTTADGLFSAGNFAIMPQDLVYVTESPVNSARALLGLITVLIGINAAL
jgi:polysaccharide export outer membrane protein